MMLMANFDRQHLQHTDYHQFVSLDMQVVGL
jgi:hypothetical protein